MEKVAYDDHLTAFIDILGFSYSLNVMSIERRQAVFILLKCLSETTQNSYIGLPFYLHDAFIDQYKPFQPGISTFSDNIAISYPIHATKLLYDSPTDDALMHLSRLTARIAVAAMESGFLIRGGVAFGPLYHADRIIFGQSLVDAYRLESHEAIFPRIVISNNVNPKNFNNQKY